MISQRVDADKPFLGLTSFQGKYIITADAGKISHKKAVEKAKIEYEKYRKAEDKKYVSDFDREMKKLLKNEKKK